MSAPVTVRTRFAPSPTGFFHIGGARTALFNWLYARHTGGNFVLRVEDTDKERNNEEFLRVIYDSLQWLGLDWDEGPGAGGIVGPYKQSERGEVYREYLKKLQDTGRVYEKEDALWFRLEGKREIIREKYKDGDNILDREVERVNAAPVIVHDIIRGDVRRAEDRDFVIVRANGEPGFHFVNVVDDIAMKITHVIRGEDHLSNTSKHIELYNAFGVTPPIFAHIPLILKSDGKGKMSKRDRGSLVEEYRARHFLPEALRNFLCLLGWTPKNGQEILPISEIISQFELTDVHQANARFDEKKMCFFNQQYLRALPETVYYSKAKKILREARLVNDAVSPVYTDAVLALVRDKLSGLEDIPARTGCFFSENYPFDPKTRESLEKKGNPAEKIRRLIPVLEELDNLDDEAAFDSALARVAAEYADKPGEYYAPLRFAVSGVGGGPHLHAMLRLLGKERVIARMRRFIQG
ncbi:MAG: glutamate--tRNA ligase [Puniceicoccales bacterium]|nr:glutamate--tRNA ligase [Puniceicoccales bacterium]